MWGSGFRSKVSTLESEHVLLWAIVFRNAAQLRWDPGPLGGVRLIFLKDFNDIATKKWISCRSEEFLAALNPKLT